MSVVFFLTHTEARLLHDACPDAHLKHKLWMLLTADVIPDDSEPRTVVFRDEGDGVHFSAVTYDDPEAADRAWEAHRLLLAHEGTRHVPDPPKTKRRSRA